MAKVYILAAVAMISIMGLFTIIIYILRGG